MLARQEWAPLPGQAAVQIDVSAIPAYQAEALARWAKDVVDRVFSLPGEEERYQEWLMARRGKQRKRKKGVMK